MPRSRPIRWLHLSDLHLGCRGQELWWQTHAELEASVRRWAEILGAPDLILFTGDLAFSGNAERDDKTVDEYRLVDQFLNELREWLRASDPEARDPLLIPVPGNHDVEWRTGQKAFPYRVLTSYDQGRDDPDVATLMDALWGEKPDTSLIDPLFANYQNWRERSVLPQRAAEGVELYLSPFSGDLFVGLDLPGTFPLAIVGLNTAWVQYRKGSDFAGKLQLPLQQFHAALNGATDGESNPLQALDGYRQALLLLHHPPSWLSSPSLKSFRGGIDTPGRFALCLFGHLHEARAESVSVSGGEHRYYHQASSLFGVEHYGTEQEARAMGYAWGQIAESGEVRLWPLKRVELGDGSWAFDWDQKFGSEQRDGKVIRPPDSLPTSGASASVPGPFEPGPPAAVQLPESDFDSYRTWALVHHSDLPLLGVGGGDLVLDLDEVYVPLQLSARAAELELDGELSAAHTSARLETGEIELEALFSRSGAPPHVLLFGDPGSGKTTALRKLAHHLLERGGPSLGLAPAALPLFARLRRLKEADLEQPLSRFLDRELVELSDRGLDDGLGAELFARGDLLLLLDGLDEIASDDLRSLVCTYLNSQLAGVEERGIRVAVSCRHTGYSSSSHDGPKIELSEPFAPVDIRPLDADLVRRFVRTWFGAAAQAQPRYTPREAGTAAERLVEALDGADYGAQQLKVLVGSPLLLTLLCVIVHQGGEMPKQRVAFYDQCLRVLLGKWSQLQRERRPPLSTDAALALLRPLAYRLHEQERRDDLSEAELLLHLDEELERLGEEASPFEVKDWLEREAGVLVAFGKERYGFLHLGVQEYLAALHVAAASAEGDAALQELCSRAGERWWREVILLLAGLPGRNLFAPLMRGLLASPVLEEEPELLAQCLQEAPEVEIGPFLEALEAEGVTPERQATLLRLLHGRSDPGLVAAARDLRESRSLDVRALAGQIVAQATRATQTAGKEYEWLLVYHPEEQEAAVGVARELEAAGVRVWLDVDRLGSADSWLGRLESLLGQVEGVAALVGSQRRVPWELPEHAAGLRLFARHRLPVRPLLLPGTDPAPELPDFVASGWIELDPDAEPPVLGALARDVAVPERTVTGAPVIGEPFTEPSAGIELVWIPGGRFQMGGTSQNASKPVHWVRVSPFWLGKTPVTNRQYARFLEATGRSEPPRWRDRRFSGKEQPVVTVSWEDAAAFCSWLSSESELAFDLPSEAQWEFAARGEDGRSYPWGNEDPDESRACYEQDWEKGRPAPVGSYPAGAGPFGTLDQAGNVWEWCRDTWDKAAYEQRAGREPLDPVHDRADAEVRVLRGGSWNRPAQFLQASFRFRDPAGFRIDRIGFRVLLSPRAP